MFVGKRKRREFASWLTQVDLWDEVTEEPSLDQAPSSLHLLVKGDRDKNSAKWKPLVPAGGHLCSSRLMQGSHMAFTDQSGVSRGKRVLIIRNGDLLNGTGGGLDTCAEVRSAEAGKVARSQSTTGTTPKWSSIER